MDATKTKVEQYEDFINEKLMTDLRQVSPSFSHLVYLNL